MTLRKLNYVSDLYSTDILRQACRRLPPKLLYRWAEHCLGIRSRRCEPNLTHLEAWLQQRVLASKESYLPHSGNNYATSTRYSEQPRNTDQNNRTNKGWQKGNENITNQNPWNGSVQNKTFISPCHLCKENHSLQRCPKYKEMDVNTRFETTKKLKLWYNCLRKDHFTSRCTSKNSCFETGCSERHHTMLHKYFTGEKHTDKSKKPEAPFPKFSGETQLSDLTKGTVYLSVVPVQLVGSGSAIVSTYSLLDSGSQSTLLQQDIAKRLKLRTVRKTISISAIKDTGKPLKVQETALEVESKENGSKIQISQCYIVPKPLFHIPSQIHPADLAVHLKHLEGIRLHSVESNQIGILIGANFPSVHIPLETRTGKESQPFAIRTLFGWALFGTYGRTDNLSFNKLQIEPETDL